MIDPLRPYWPTNRSLAGLIVRVSCLGVAAAASLLSTSRPLLLAIVFMAAAGQASFVALGWMELGKTRKPGMAVALTCLALFLGLVLALFFEGRSVLTLTQR